MEDDSVNEWDNIKSQEFTKEGIQIIEEEIVKSVDYDYVKVEKLLMALDTSEIRKNTQYLPPKSKFCRGPAKLKKKLAEELVQLFALSKTTVFNVSGVQDMLVALYKKFFGKTCVYVGNHWESVGFQGTDPRTDFRSCGVLALMHMEYAAFEESVITNKILKLSQDNDQMFPFAVISINITGMVLEAFRRGIINRYCNERDSSVETMNLLFISTYYYWYLIWEHDKRTISDCSQTLEVVKDECIENGPGLIKTFLNYKRDKCN